MAGDNKAKMQREAEKFVIQGKISQAIAEYQKIIKIDPEDVLTLNTIGDLCLRMGKPQEASAHFSQVADHYVRNNFLLKAIAVYKKILGCDPQNVAVHTTLASLYAKQGLNVEARNEFLRVAEICTSDGKSADARLAYEKVAELDPTNIPAQLKLSEINLQEGSKEKAHSFLVAAARAQAKSGDSAAALNSFERALELKADDLKTMAGLLDASIKTGNVARGLEQLKKSLDSGFESIELLEMLANAYLANNDTENASLMLRRVIALNESRYSLYLELQKKLMERKDMDAAATCLDPVIPILIEKRATKHVIEAYKSILAKVPDHLPSLTRLAELYSAANDKSSYLATLDKICGDYMERGLHKEALGSLEKILQATPTSDKHLRMHRQAFETVFPGIPYTSPVPTENVPASAAANRALEEAAPAEGGVAAADPALVEADLLLNYGMKDKALELLRGAEVKDPSDVRVRLRLLSLYKENNQISLAAEECLYLALAHRKLGDEEAAQKYIDEAGRLDPAVVSSRPELLALAYQQGAATEPGSRGPAGLAGESAGGLEVDLSEDLSDIFFKDQGKSAAEPEGVSTEIAHDDMAEEFVPSAVPPRPPAALPDQLQEVDFYIRLGFFDEARAKLSELEKDHHGHPDLILRQRQIAEVPSQSQAASGASVGGADTIELVSEESNPEIEDLGEDLKLIEEPPQELDFAVVGAEEEKVQALEPPPVPQPEEEPPLIVPIPPQAQPAPVQALPVQAPPAQILTAQALPVQAPPAQIPTEQALPVQAPPAQIPTEQALPFQVPPAQIPTAQASPVQAPPAQIPVAENSPVQAPPAQVPPAQTLPAQVPPAKVQPVQEAVTSEPKGMFADLLEEVNSLTDQEIAREEYDTHFSLGIAYREMSLIDEAIKEFQEAMKAISSAQHPTEVIQCCGMLSTCFLDKGMPRSAIRWCETGLAIPQISQHESMALSYDMGVALAALGEADKALDCFTSLQQTDPGYRDVAHKIEELRGNSSQHVT